MRIVLFLLAAAAFLSGGFAVIRTYPRDLRSTIAASGKVHGGKGYGLQTGPIPPGMPAPPLPKGSPRAPERRNAGLTLEYATRLRIAKVPRTTAEYDARLPRRSGDVERFFLNELDPRGIPLVGVHAHAGTEVVVGVFNPAANPVFPTDRALFAFIEENGFRDATPAELLTAVEHGLLAGNRFASEVCALGAVIYEEPRAYFLCAVSVNGQEEFRVYTFPDRFPETGYVLLTHELR